MIDGIENKRFNPVLRKAGRVGRGRRWLGKLAAAHGATLFLPCKPGSQARRQRRKRRYRGFREDLDVTLVLDPRQKALPPNPRSLRFPPLPPCFGPRFSWRRELRIPQRGELAEHHRRGAPDFLSAQLEVGVFDDDALADMAGPAEPGLIAHVR